ncbi:MAG: permease [Vallitaleaceae bacterium]|jgi:uncharacterized membrane protein YraQ (UPF0718 family)|nr:permease [Vallitaleaceae bacterium]
MVTTIIFYSVSLGLLGLSFLKDKKKTKMALKKAYIPFTKLLPALFPMIMFVGIMLTFISPELIGKVLGEESGIFGVMIAAVVGSVVFMPSFVAFNLGENLLANGAGYVQVGVLIATLMAVGITSIGIELKYFDKKMTILRNSMAFIASMIFAVILGVTM